MKRTPFIFAAMSLISSVSWASDRTISVSGSCNRPTVSDRGAITLTAEVTDKDLQTASTKATAAYEHLREAILRLKLANSEIRTSEYQVTEHKEWEKERSVSKGFRARMGLHVSTSDIQRLGEAIAIATSEGIRDVGQLQTFLSEDRIRKEQFECLQTAAENARAKAEKLANALGAKVGEVYSLTEEGATNPTPLLVGSDSLRFSSKQAEINAPSVEAGKQEINLTVHAVFKIN